MLIENTISYKLLKYWLLTSILLIFFMIIVGGLTRLTDSGLSITQWELFEGILPPLNNNQWNEYFNLYKKIPQYDLINNMMTLNEFKIIYYWEYFHRLLGRFIGIFFIVPLLYFSFIKILSKKYLINFYLIFLLICFQGFIGWYMVKSGLVSDITVSHYRLSIHLVIAFIIISSLFWNYLNILNFTFKKITFLNYYNYPIKILFILVLFQILLGAFVSGLDAGKIYQTWPLMNNTFFPDDSTILTIKDYFNFENKSLVQFYHRNLAYIIIGYFFLISFRYFKSNNVMIIKNFLIVLIVILIQIFLGIFTLISGLNLYLASLHQISSILLILSVLNLNYCCSK